jgi:hypothetical protein
VAVTILYLIVTPVALLRARTQVGRILAVIVPVTLFHAARVIIPSLVMQQPIQLQSGDIILSINVVLSFVLAAVLYRHFGEGGNEVQRNERLEAAPITN